MALARSAIVLGLLALVALPASAHAGTYDVYSCTLPNGSAAPTEGWSAQLTGKPGFSVSNTCVSPPSAAPTGAMGGKIISRSARGDLVTWIFTAPKFTIIDGFTLYRAAHTAGGGSWFHDFGISYGLRGPLDQDHWAEFCSPLMSCSGRGVGRQQPFHAANRFSVSGVALQQIFAQLQCDTIGPDTCEPGSDHGQFEVYSARMSLADAYAPTFTRPPDNSLLAVGDPVVGERALTFSAADRGAGIEKVGVVVDGVIRTQRRGDASRRCQRPFMALVPCPPTLTTTLILDTAKLANGTHTIQASVTDAAGNETRSDPVTVTTLNGSQPNGRGASRFVKLSAYLRSKRDKPRRTAVVAYGKTRFAEGRLTDAAGSPIAGAILQVTSRVQRPGAKARAVGTVTTSEDGRFAYRIAKGPSRTVGFGYKAYSLDPAPVSTAHVSLGVKAGIRLKVGPRNVRNGQTIRFTGRLRGGPARKGTRLTIDVLVPDARRRLPIGTVRADRNGRFRFTYRFQRTLVKARYRFQARLAAQPGYPYRGAASRRVAVVVSP